MLPSADLFFQSLYNKAEVLTFMFIDKYIQQARVS